MFIQYRFKFLISPEWKPHWSYAVLGLDRACDGISDRGAVLNFKWDLVKIQILINDRWYWRRPVTMNRILSRIWTELWIKDFGGSSGEELLFSFTVVSSPHYPANEAASILCDTDLDTVTNLRWKQSPLLTWWHGPGWGLEIQTKVLEDFPITQRRPLLGRSNFMSCLSTLLA